MFTPNTEVRLLSNVPLSNTYEHQLTFANVSEQTSFFQGKQAHRFTEFTYQREKQGVAVAKGYDDVLNCNYLMYRNSNYSNKWFYAFITEREYVNPSTTRIKFEIDVYQTWMFDFTFRPSFVVREHARRWNADGSPVINTVDEGLDYGSEYETVKVDNYLPHTDLFFLVVVTKSAMHSQGGTDYTNDIVPSVNGSPQPLNYYIHPFKMDGSVPPVSVGGSTANMSTILEMMRNLFTQEGAVNNVVSLYVTEYFDNISYTNGAVSLSSNSFENVRVADNNNPTIDTIRVKNLGNYRSKLLTVGAKYDGFTNPSESKLLMYPYTTTIVDDFKGSRLELKNEYINSETLQLRVKGSLGTSNKVVYQVESYNHSTNNQHIGLETALVNNNPNDLPIITEMLSAYLQGNRNSIDNQKASAMFNAVIGTVGGLVGGQAIGVGGKLGALAGAGVGATNSFYQIEAINAKQRDIENTPPQLVKMGGNTAFDYGNDIKGVYVIKKQITAEYRKKLTDFFKMYGYKRNEVKVPNMKTRQHFNYVQTVGANITGNIPQDDITTLRNMFNNGVTLWHGDWVGDYARSNNEL